MRINWLMLRSGRLVRQKSTFAWPVVKQGTRRDVWLDIEAAETDELRKFLEPLGLHPLQLAHCLDSDIDPGVLVFSNTILMEYPATYEHETTVPTYLTIILQASVLVTVRHGSIPALDDLIRSLTDENPPLLHHLPELLYQILDQFADMNVGIQIAIRDRIQEVARTLVETPAAIDSKDLTLLRFQVGNLISLLENQLYCASRLAASDVKTLRDPHRKAYMEDLVSEAEIAQRGGYRLETRVNELYRDYQMVGSDRVERRLRLLTIVSAITLPLGLIAGLLGMNVAGIPGTTVPSAFFIVVIMMAAIALAQYWYFKWKGWFE
jgi:Mg2+ and Co2+ transporter CorA